MAKIFSQEQMDEIYAYFKDKMNSLECINMVGKWYDFGVNNPVYFYNTYNNGTTPINTGSQIFTTDKRQNVVAILLYGCYGSNHCPNVAYSINTTGNENGSVSQSFRNGDVIDAKVIIKQINLMPDNNVTFSVNDNMTSVTNMAESCSFLLFNSSGIHNTYDIVHASSAYNVRYATTWNTDYTISDDARYILISYVYSGYDSSYNVNNANYDISHNGTSVQSAVALSLFKKQTNSSSSFIICEIECAENDIINFTGSSGSTWATGLNLIVKCTP